MLKQLATVSQQGPASRGRLVTLMQQQQLLLLDGFFGLANLQGSAEDLRKAIARRSPSTGSVFLPTSGNVPTASRYSPCTILLLYASNGALDCTEVTASNVLHSPARQSLKELQALAQAGPRQSHRSTGLWLDVLWQLIAWQCQDYSSLLLWEQPRECACCVGACLADSKTCKHARRSLKHWLWQRPRQEGSPYRPPQAHAKGAAAQKAPAAGKVPRLAVFSIPRCKNLAVAGYVYGVSCISAFAWCSSISRACYANEIGPSLADDQINSALCVAPESSKGPA